MSRRVCPSLQQTVPPSRSAFADRPPPQEELKRSSCNTLAFGKPGLIISSALKQRYALQSYKLGEAAIAKAYWIATYFSISNPEALAAYAKLAGPAIAAAGGRFLARGTAAKAYEKGLTQRVVLVEFDSVEQAAAAHDSPGYQAALKVLGNAVERDLRIVEGVS